MKRMPLLMLMSLCALYCGTGCSNEKKEVEEPIKLVATSPLQKDTTIIKQYVAQIHSVQRIELRALEKGYLEKIYVDEGQHVQQGQLMFQIKPTVYQAELKKSQAEANYVGLEYQNTKKLADKNIVSGSELALAQAKYDKANADVSLAQTHLQFTTGSLVDEGDLLTTLSDNSKMWVYFNVPEAEYLAYEAHAKASDSAQKVKLMMANNEVFNQPGLVQTIEADFNNETGNIAFRATFPNPNGLLRNGETGSVLMTVPLKNALIIPQKATFEILEKKYVFVVDKKSVVHQQEIGIASEMPDLYVIKSGITGTDRILLEGLRKVKDGDKVSYEYKAPQAVISHLKVYSE